MLSVVAVELVPTATYAHRECEWVPGDPAHLVIRLRKTRHGKEEADVYAVEEQTAPTDDVRAFLLESTTQETPDVYETVIGSGWTTCSCTAGQVTRNTQKHSCKHQDSLLCLLATGEV